MNTIFLKLFSSIDNTVYSTLDNILFIHSGILKPIKFQQLFGTDASNGFLLIANSLIFGIILFYVIYFAISHLIYSHVDSPYQFLFKCVIFITCANSSLWICERFINLVAILSGAICEIGYSISGTEISFASLINYINEILYPNIENFNIFSIDGILKLVTSFGIVYALLIYAIRYVMCHIMVLLSPFAFLSLINHRTDGFFKGWLKQFISLMAIQIIVAIVLVLGFTLDFMADNLLSKLIYFSLIAVIAKTSFTVKELLELIHQYSHDTLKKFV